MHFWKNDENEIGIKDYPGTETAAGSMRVGNTEAAFQYNHNDWRRSENPGLKIKEQDMTLQ
jgi:hypothetical protein